MGGGGAGGSRGAEGLPRQPPQVRCFITTMQTCPLLFSCLLCSELMKLMCSTADLLRILGATLPPQTSIPSHQRRSWKNGKRCRHLWLRACRPLPVVETPLVFRGFTHSGTALLMLRRAQKMKSKNPQHKEGVFICNILMVLMHY